MLTTELNTLKVLRILQQRLEVAEHQVDECDETEKTFVLSFGQQQIGRASCRERV